MKYMLENIINHLVTVIFKSENNDFDGTIFNENIETKNHVPSLKNIEYQLNHSFRIPYISNGHYDPQDVIYDHTSYGNIVIEKIVIDEINSFYIFLPEVLTDTQTEIIVSILNELKNYEVHLMRQNGEWFRTEHKDNYVNIKSKRLTFDLQKRKFITKKI